jgi:Ni/Fe-hydrogenase subunit HybB-like protein
MLAVLAAIGCVAGAYRFGFGLRASTNLDHFYPWGLWIIADVSLIALAAGGFVTATVVHVLHRGQYHFLSRPALLTALLGYTFACVLLAADLGKYYNIWHPILPRMWQGNSALFEVGLCVMTYLIILYVEFVPVICERFVNDLRRPFLRTICRALARILEKSISVFIVLGVGISCLHQSSLGHIFVLAPWKLHPLWWTPILSLMFLLSAVVAGLPTVIFVCLCYARTFEMKPPMTALAGLARYVPLLLTVYLAVKIGDLLIRKSYVHLIDGSPQSVAFVLELGLGLVVPLVMLLSTRVRTSPRGLAMACALVMFGVVMNRANVYWIGFEPVNAPHLYTPSITEWAFTIGVIAMLVVVWKWMATVFPIITETQGVRHI